VRPIAAASIVLCVVVIGITSGLAFLPERSGEPSFWALAIVPTVALAAVAAIWAQREDFLFEWLGPRWGDFSRGLLGAVVLFGLAWIFTRVLTPVGSSRELWLVSLYAQIGDPRVLQKHAPVVGGAIVVASGAEELLWRGTVTQLLAERVGSRVAWIWAAVLYALAYAPTMWSLRAGASAGLNPILVIAAFGASLLWGAMARVFGRLPPCIVAHAFFDWAAVMMFPFWGPGSAGT
jgi:membrane protease YdiL (CAAX protease family)